MSWSLLAVRAELISPFAAVPATTRRDVQRRSGVQSLLGCAMPILAPPSSTAMLTPRYANCGAAIDPSTSRAIVSVGTPEIPVSIASAPRKAATGTKNQARRRGSVSGSRGASPASPRPSAAAPLLIGSDQSAERARARLAVADRLRGGGFKQGSALLQSISRPRRCRQIAEQLAVAAGSREPPPTGLLIKRPDPVGCRSIKASLLFGHMLALEIRKAC